MLDRRRPRPPRSLLIVTILRLSFGSSIPITGKTLSRSLDLGEARNARTRLLALAISELIWVSWTELETNPEPAVLPAGGRAPAEEARKAAHVVDLHTRAGRRGAHGGGSVFLGRHVRARGVRCSWEVAQGSAVGSRPAWGGPSTPDSSTAESRDPKGTLRSWQEARAQLSSWAPRCRRFRCEWEEGFAWDSRA